MDRLRFHDSKSLKLTNVLKYKIMDDNENVDLHVIIEQMKSYIRAKGAMQIGPLIQYAKMSIGDKNELEFEVIMMLQCSNYIHNVEHPYYMEAILRIPNALYCRYTGPESTLKYAYDKINVEAFEKNIAMENCNYTIFVDKNVEEDIIVADVFVPRAENT